MRSLRCNQYNRFVFALGFAFVTIDLRYRQVYAMSRLIFFSLLIYLCVYLIKRTFKQFSQRQHDTMQQANTMHDQRMVKCEQCSLYLPHAEAIIHNEKSYCCQAHVEAI